MSENRLSLVKTKTITQHLLLNTVNHTVRDRQFQPHSDMYAAFERNLLQKALMPRLSVMLCEKTGL